VIASRNKVYHSIGTRVRVYYSRTFRGNIIAIVRGMGAMSDEEPTNSDLTPISSHIEVPAAPLFDFVREALAAVDVVHSDGALPFIPVVRGSRMIGRYVPTREGDASRIEVAMTPGRRRLSFVHEIGHVLDHQALGTPGAYASESGRLRRLMQTIDRSAALASLRERGRHKQITTQDRRGNMIRFRIDAHDVAYLLEPRECFARAYAQYIAVRSGDSSLLAQLDDKRGDLLTQAIYYEQWTDADFTPIADDFDRLLRRKGWLR